MMALYCTCGQRFRAPVVCPVYCPCGRVLYEADLTPGEYAPTLPAPACAHLGPILGRIDCGCDGGNVYECSVHGRCLPRPPSKPLVGRTLILADGTRERIAAGQRVQTCRACPDSTV